MDENIILKAENINKSFPGVVALDNVNFYLREGEVHALLGENGAGKSTLIKVITGVHSFDGGNIQLNGENFIPKSPYHAQESGISTVYQEVNLCSNLSVAENIFIGRKKKTKKTFNPVNWKEMNKKAKELLKELDIEIDVTKTLDSYSVAIQQMVAIARAISVSAKILILDEPTSSLNQLEVKNLFKIMRKLKKDGLGIVFVTHFLDQVYEVSDKITILRNGTLVGEFNTSELKKVDLIGKMIGKEYDEFSSMKSSEEKSSNKEVFIEVKGVTSTGLPNEMSLNINKGEVLGLSGLLGSGRSEVSKVLFGIDKTFSGEMKIKGDDFKLKNPIDSIRKGIAYCPEDRKASGIVGDLSIKSNIILALQAKKGMFKFINNKEQEKLAESYIKLLQIKTPSSEQLIKNLSGGNQQKVILARWLATNPDLLILDEPTRGIDIGTKAEIQKIVINLANQGMSVIFISSEIDEMIRSCSRIVVLHEKKLIGELSGEEINENTIMNTIAGGIDDEGTEKNI